ncbi:hypothetical protein BU24DRAFT_154977 [Aaosphaeria arxii CBS 175.79]|uniref:Uncharacterized protein n=1 Tax=Aaosphaeria arxii CBS 175.79 TaxID=1450172 RepID=A0A6A5XY64_9PLEO|nr:uncharacterized protein BU24DRAFT_154977 [Aaosphaeria arxii CBS 175.79]KAF2017651.1 hypothetical protein BU24DRAFT_154977 [Aaosphaeria arxii CBS 175.79]
MPFNFIKSIFPAQPSPGNGRSVPEQPPQRTRRSPKEYEARVTKSRRASGTSQSSPSSLSEEESPEEPHSLRRRLSSYNPDEEEGWGVGTTVATVLEEPAPPRVRAPKTPPRTVIMQPSTVPTGGKGGQTVSPEGRRKIRERWAKKVDEIKENAVRNAIVEADNLGVSAEDREQGVREIKSSIEAASGQSQYQKGQQPKPITNQSKMPLGNRKPRPAPRPPKVKKRVVKPDEEKSEWELRPHELAQKMFKEHAGDAKRVAEAIKASLAADGIAHPEYALRDVELRNAHWQLINLVEAFSEEYFDFQFDDTESLTERLAEFAPETVRIIGCVASGGPGGPGGWHQMFTYAPKRRALVCAIIGNVIFEQVYQHLFFGGHRSQLEELGRVQKQMANADGKYSTNNPPHLQTVPQTDHHRLRSQPQIRRNHIRGT